jgi:hypothetical protein
MRPRSTQHSARRTPRRFDFVNPSAEPFFQSPVGWTGPTDPTQGIVVRTLPAHESLDQIRSDTIRSTETVNLKATVTVETACKGTALVDRSVEYEAMYVSAGTHPLSPDVVKSLESLCSPV